MLQKYLSAFGLIQNTAKLFSTASNEETQHLKLLNGLRVIMMVWVILGHTFFFMPAGGAINTDYVFYLTGLFAYNIITTATFAVDVFFWMSGFLGTYILMCSMKKKNGEMPNPLVIFAHRIIRITPLFLMVFLFNWTVMTSVGEGPVSFLYNEKEAST